MAKIKNVAIFVLAALMLFGICAISAGCSDDKKLTEEVTTGTFYSLQEAYENNLLTRDDLIRIAYYHNTSLPHHPYFEEWGSAEYKSVSENITELSEKLEYAIKISYVQKHNRPPEDIESVHIKSYYGAYNGSIALMITGFGYYPAVIGEVEIDGIKFLYNDGNRIKIWKCEK